MKYKVLAPYLVFTIHGESGQKDYSLKKGDTVELPDEHRTVRVLLDRKQIEPEQEAPPAKTTKK